MSYTDPTESDKEKLTRFHERLDEHFDRESQRNIVVDNIRISFDRYLHPETHSETWSAPFPPMSREEFRELSTDERAETIREKSLSDIQEAMENAALLSQLHNVDLEDITGLEQSSEALRERLNQARSNSQTTVAEFS